MILRPTKPTKPVKPTETKSGIAYKYLYEGDTAAELMRTLQSLVDEHGVNLEEAEFHMYQGSQYDTPAPTIEYFSSKPNTHYKSEMKQYEKDLQKYNQAIIKFEEENATYQKYAKEVAAINKKYKSKK